MNVKQLLNKKSLSTADKESIIAEAELLGLDTNINHGCSDCYRDLLVQIGVKQNENSDNEVQQPEPAPEETNILQNWKLKDGVDIRFGISKTRINAETITPSLAAKLFNAWGERYFEKICNSESNQITE